MRRKNRFHHRIIRKIRQKRSFYQTFGILLGLSLLTAVVFTVYLDRLLIRERRESLVNLNLERLEKTAEEVDSVLAVMSNALEDNLWDRDMWKVLLTLDLSDHACNSRIIRSLQTAVERNGLIREAFLYSPLMEYVFSSSGRYLPIGESEEEDIICRLKEKDAVEISENGKLKEEEGRLFLCFAFRTPVYVGDLFFELDVPGLQAMIGTEEESVIVLDQHKNQILSSAKFYEEADFITRTESAEDTILGSASHAYYQTASSLTGWIFLQPVDQTGMPDIWGDILKLLIPFLFGYVIVCICLSFSISRSLYRPIRRLLMAAGERKLSGEEAEKKSETDYLEQIYAETFSENIQYRDILNSISDEIIDQLLYKLLMGKNLSYDYLEETLRMAGGEMLLEGRFLVVAGMLEYPKGKDSASMEMVMYRRSIMNVFREFVPNGNYVFLRYLEDRRMTAVFCFSEEMSVTEIQKFTGEVYEKAEHEAGQAGIRLYLGTGKVCGDIRGLLSAYQEAAEEASYQKYSEGEGLEDAKIEPSQDSLFRQYLSERWKAAMALAAEGNREEGEILIQGLLSEIGKEKTREEYRRGLKLFRDAVAEAMITGGMAVEDVERLIQKWSGFWKEEAEPEDLEEAAFQFSRDAMRVISTNGRKNRYRYVEEAKGYIERHFADSGLSQDEVSEYIGITSSYLSILFKEITTEKFNGYLNRYRVEQAQKLLKTTTYSISDIGYKCGFNSNQSFYRVFKKHTMVTPNQYREIQKEREGETE
ncbi:helix-turn-helix transcriptional regulator [Hominifimenecus sp. rT4P-3]|uniref:helix-turn-helix transcriptional regulator n=1 Tax=Hominifimenecus sp. rT4P-3 TaxID=3242979 RepID=UPI003DA262F8